MERRMKNQSNATTVATYGKMISSKALSKNGSNKMMMNKHVS